MLAGFGSCLEVGSEREVAGFEEDAGRDVGSFSRLHNGHAVREVDVVGEDRDPDDFSALIVQASSQDAFPLVG